MRSGNPALGEKTFDGSMARADAGAGVMTIQGAINKTTILMVILLLAGGYTWSLFANGENPEAAKPWMIGGAIAGFVLALVTIFVRKASPFTAPL